MLVRIISITLAVCFWALYPAYADEPQIIAVFGDSLIAGYKIASEDAFPAQLEKALRQDGYNVRVINDGIAGETSANALARLDEVLNQKPDIVILEFGTNDFFSRFTPKETRKNLAAIIEKCKQSDIRILLVGITAPLSLGQEYVIEFKAVYTRLAKIYNLALYPSFLEGVYGNPALTLDSIHPNPQGVKILVEHIYPTVITLLK